MTVPKLVLATAVAVSIIGLSARAFSIDDCVSDAGATVANPQKQSDQNSPPSALQAGSTSQVQIVYPPADIYTAGDCQSRATLLVIRPTATAKGLHGPSLLSGELVDKDSHATLPADAFQLVQETPTGGRSGKPYDPAPVNGEISDSHLTRVHILLKKDWIRAGNYAGVLRVGAVEDTAGQDIKLNVSVRPGLSWWLGSLLIAFGALISWYALVYTARQRQMAGNQIVVARLAELLGKLRTQLNAVSDAGAPPPSRTLDHIALILQKRLQQLLTDKELSVIAGITVPLVGNVSVLDEIEGVNRIVQNGFSQLLDLWNRPGIDQSKLKPFFGEMDEQGSKVNPLPDVDQGIKTIIAAAGSAVSAQKVMPDAVALRGLPSEDAVVHRVVFTTHLLDAISFLTVVVLGVYIMIWKNPGFGSFGNLIEAFFWGLGVKLGTDVARLGPSDVRTAIGIRIPSAA
jgi:hypothetical protein